MLQVSQELKRLLILQLEVVLGSEDALRRERDPLADGKLDLPERLEEPTPEEFAWARNFIAERRWREAVTYRETAPHEYVVRTWETGEIGSRDFDHFITLIRRFGYADFFYKVRHIYWPIDEFKYWTMGWPVAETTVINRARVDAPEPWKEP